MFVDEVEIKVEAEALELVKDYRPDTKILS